ncbi:YheT family hydrolase [Fulvivirga lutea]|uniref:Alpha/beta fold hydrolase n=1 Tax=Fulvivirga lutea TaxID=2810512 RepID=A0A975A064_9BACT|nr:alpha/beta fold hydrolase [Fulvivirga lutea]QSE97059.1 alpha/beta fold hydrolase [Fulvivirga lutea]
MKYKPPKIYLNSHFETIIPALFRKVSFEPYSRERIKTPDDDFLDLDWVTQDSNKLVIISHGLEGNSEKPYVRGMGKAFYSEGYDVCAWNYRGCSGEVNKKLRFYHSGATDDLDTVVKHCLNKNYDELVLVGFSLGGNITLKYLGEQGQNVTKKISKAVAISVPVNLHTSCIKISKPGNLVYSKRFLRNLKKKVRNKARIMPDQLDIKGLGAISTLIEFDNRYTAPIHGFNDAVDYYTKCSSLYFLDSIARPTLVINAKNDPFLSEDCYPTKQLENHPFVTLEIPDYGGHVGFTEFNDEKMYWSEKRAVAFASTSEG